MACGKVDETCWRPSFSLWTCPGIVYYARWQSLCTYWNTGANKQTQLLMSVKYKVHLPDHDFATAVKQKLTPTAKCVTVDILI